MNEHEALETLAAEARRETPSPIDVTHRVMETIRLCGGFAEDPAARQLTWIAAIGGVLMLLLALPAFDAWTTLVNPVANMLSSLSEVLP